MREALGALSSLIFGAIIVTPTTPAPEGADSTMAKALAEFGNSNSHPQEIRLLDSIPSPDGKLVAERYLMVYPEDSAVAIALHPPQVGPATPSQYIPYKSVDHDVLFKWLDNSNLLIAAPQGNPIETQLNQFAGVHLQYGHYLNDPDIPRIAGAQTVFRKQEDFTYNFITNENHGVPNIACHLVMTAADGEYVDSISLMLTAEKLYPHGEWKRSPKNAYAVNIYADKDIRKSLTFGTGAKVEDFSPGDKSSVRGVRLFEKVKMPKGISMPMWQLVYDLPDKNALLSIVDRAKHGNLRLKVGFWLDNAEVIYSSNAPKDTSAIEAFERCYEQNHILTN